MLQKLRWDSLQQRRACSRVLMLYRIRNGLVAIPAAAYLEPVPICTRRFETRYVQIQCNTSTYSQTFFPSAIRLWNTLSVDVCQVLPDTCKTHLNSFRFIWAPLLGGTQLLPRVGGLLRPGWSFCPSSALDRPGKQFFSVCMSVCFRLSNDYVRDFHQILYAAQKIMWSDQCLLFARQTGSKFPVLERISILAVLRLWTPGFAISAQNSVRPKRRWLCT